MALVVSVLVAVLALTGVIVVGILAIRTSSIAAQPAVTVTQTKALEAETVTVTATEESTGSATTKSTSTAGTTSRPPIIPSQSGSGTERLNPTGGYELVYENETLTLNPPVDSRGSRKIDLDGPGVVLDDSGDATVGWNFGVITGVSFENPLFAKASGRTATPEECADSFMRALISQNVVPALDASYCATTDGLGPTGEPQRQKISVFTFSAVPDKSTIVVTVSAWSIPR